MKPPAVLILFVCQLFGAYLFHETDKRVIGGSEAPTDKYRWAVSIKGNVDKVKASGACGASILKTEGNAQWLITAAHCFFAKLKSERIDLTNPKHWHARVGLTKVDFYYQKHGFGYKVKSKLKSFFNKAYKKLFGKEKFSVTTNDLHVKKIILHPQYEDGELEYDIALMKLVDPLPIHQLKGVNTIDLPPKTVGKEWPATDSDCFVVGWGCVVAAGRPNPIAKLAVLKVWNNTRCEEAFNGPIGLNPDSEFCAGYLQKGYGLCPGDSGSGLACALNGQWTVAGVVSAAHAESPGQFPAIFTRVSAFNDWIVQTIRDN